MARTAPTKSRAHLLADALEAVVKTRDSLRAIDLRTTRGDLRDSIRAAREESTTLETELRHAMAADAEELRDAG